jgi:hypothetical protein
VGDAASKPGFLFLSGPFATALAAALAVACVAALSPRLAMLLVPAAALATAVWVHPPVAAYLVLGVTPLVVGIDRGRLIPLFRPSEVLVLVLGGALVVRRGADWLRRRGAGIRLIPLEVSLVFMAVAASLFPLLWMTFRGVAITQDDLLYALDLWKFLGVYVVIRMSIRTEPEVRACLWIAMAAASVVAVIGMLEALKLFGVPRLLATYYAPFGVISALKINRGGSTLALPAAVADLMCLNLAIAAGLLASGARHQVVLIGAAVVFIFGVVASGQFTGGIGLLTAAVAIAYITRKFRPVLAFAPAAPVAGVLLWPVVQRRLTGFASPAGLPVSWVGRLSNLRTYFWPELWSHYNWALGVRTSARVATATQNTGYVWIESGHTWLLWGGGVPLLAGFFVFLWVGFRTTRQVARSRSDAIGVAATAAFVGLVVIAVVMIFDPHLTYRGSADLFFALLALSALRPDPVINRGERERAP